MTFNTEGSIYILVKLLLKLPLLQRQVKTLFPLINKFKSIFVPHLRPCFYATTLWLQVKKKKKGPSSFFCIFLHLFNGKKELSVPQPSIFSNEMRIAQISLNTDTAVWVIQLLPWWPEDLAFPSTAAHATLNTLHSPVAFPPSDMRVKQTSQRRTLKHWSTFWVLLLPFLSPFAPWH